MKTNPETAGSDNPANEPDPAEPETEDRLRSENEQLRTTLRSANARHQLVDALRSAGARTPQLLFDAVRDDLQFADDGTLANAEALIKRMSNQFPEQFSHEAVHTSIDGGAGRIAAPVLTKEALAKMTPAEIAKLDWAAVRQVLANG